MLVAYPQPNKRKAQTICDAFVQGVRRCGGEAKVTDGIPQRLEDGAAFFYGVRPGWVHLWDQAKAEKRTWVYCDNSYWDSCREKYFRITRNALQCDGLQMCQSGDGAQRFKALGITVRDWQRGGGHIVVCPNTEEFMATVGGVSGDWVAQVTTELRHFTDRTLRVRWKGDERPLAFDLAGAHALVTHMSCAAVEALVAGVPVFCTGRCAARWMGSSDLSMIETPYYPERRQEFMEVLAENQWTVEEMKSGTAWSDLNGRN
jgi:hypothetical protein